MKFIVTGDLHFGLYPDISPDITERSEKLYEGARLAGYCNDHNIHAVLVCGDLCDHGYGKFCCKRDPDELGGLINGYVTPLKNANIETLLCRGNHDTYCNIWPQFLHPVKRYIIKEFGDVNYVRMIGEIRFISMDIHPTKQSIDWLRTELEDNPDCPTVLQWHYNMRGAFSDWWGDDLKRSLYETIKDYKIICICVGHRHESSERTWNLIPVVSGADRSVMVCEYTPEAGLKTSSIDL